ncbi:FAD-binding protein [Streptomyces sp. BA2]|uniref:FAD-binding protein n=1 Tax=Streptomyces sp. BA2 TaxID=436595 RepID=UPI003FA7A630
MHCIAHGIDPSRTPMPVAPAAHYTCGGIRTDLDGRTRMPGLYAAGEAACTGPARSPPAGLQLSSGSLGLSDRLHGNLDWASFQ